jgi:ankyrin repeat protein
MGACGGLLRIDYETNTPEPDILRAVEWLVQNGSDIHATNNAGENALHAAAIAGLDSVVEWLVRKGAPINARTKAGKTAFELAEKLEVTMQVIVRESTAKLLKKLGAE